MILAVVEGNVLVLLLMAIFGFISWLSNRAQEKKQQPQPPQTRQPSSAPPRRAAADSEEERMRKFLEALGLPTDAPPPPPPPVAPRPAPTPRPVVSAPPPMPAPRARPVPVPPPMPEPAREFVESSAFPPAREEPLPALVPFFAESDLTASSQPATSRADSRPAAAPVTVHEALRAALASPQQLRSAFVLREVLGPPPGLQR